MIEYSIYELQEEFLSDESKLVLFCAGVGSGKTTCGALWSIMQAVKYPKARGFIGANTYLQLHKSTLIKLFQLLRDFGIDYEFNKSPPWGNTAFEDHKNVLSLCNGSQILCYSLDNYDVIRGIEIGWAWVDEARDTDPEAFDILLERFRGYDVNYPSIPYQMKITSTPAGFNWLYSKFVDPKTKLPGTKIIVASSYDNPFINDKYADELESRLGKQLARQQIYAEFINLTSGRAFTFNSARNVKSCKYNPDLKLCFSMDFNVSPLCGIIFQYDYKNRMMWILDEVYIPDSGQTREACVEFARRYRSNNPKIIEYYGDAAALARSTRGTDTDFSIMDIALKENFPKCKVIEGSDRRRHYVFEGIQAVNALLDPSKGDARLIIDPKCTYLIRDFEQLAFKPGTRELDKSNKELSHLCDCTRYVVQQHWPITGPNIIGSWSPSD